MQPTLADLRALSRRSIAAQNAGFLAMFGTLPLFVIVVAFPLWWVQGTAVAVSGLLFVNYARNAGRARGEFRLVFRRLKEEKRAMRSGQDGPTGSQEEILRDPAGAAQA